MRNISSSHIEGQPNVIVQNMDGAGGLIGAQYLGEVAPKDGTVLGALTGTAWIYANDPGRWRVDFRNYEFIARQPSTTIHFVRTDVPPGIKAPADIVKAKGLIVGGLSADTSKDLRLRLGARHAGRAVPVRHRLSLVAAGAACAPARRDPHVLRIAAELSLGRRAANGGRPGIAIPVFYDEVGEPPPVVRRAGRGTDHPDLSAALQGDQGHDAVGPLLGGLPDPVRDELDAAARCGAAARRAGGGGIAALAQAVERLNDDRNSPPKR